MAAPGPQSNASMVNAESEQLVELITFGSYQQVFDVLSRLDVSDVAAAEYKLIQILREFMFVPIMDDEMQSKLLLILDMAHEIFLWDICFALYDEFCMIEADGKTRADTRLSAQPFFTLLFNKMCAFFKKSPSAMSYALLVECYSRPVTADRPWAASAFAAYSFQALAEVAS